VKIGIYNVNARKCTAGGVYVQYQLDGRAEDCAFADWQLFISWFQVVIDKEAEDVRKITAEVRTRDAQREVRGSTSI
jgi:hypothetical protein